MKRPPHTAWWTHTPAVLLLVGFCAWFLHGLRAWPSQVPLQIAWTGEPTMWGSKWIALALVLGMGLLFLSLSILIDSLWAKQESKKRFNLLSLLDEVVIGLLVAIQAAFLRAAVTGEQIYRVPLPWLLLVVGGGILMGVLVEWLRPYRPSAMALIPAGRLEELREDIAKRVDAGQRLVYWDVQNPRYVAWLSLGLPMVLWALAGYLAAASPWVAAIEAAVGLLFIQFYGGQRTRVTHEGISIRYGLLGFRIFRCRLSEITAIRIRSFAPLADFGGYGIRMASGVTAYYLAGRRGVQLELQGRRSVLIGSGNPERLAAVIEGVSGIRAEYESEDNL